MVNSVYMNCLTQIPLFTSCSLITPIAGKVAPGDITQHSCVLRRRTTLRGHMALTFFCPAAVFTHCKCAVWSRCPSETSMNQFSYQKKNSMNAELLIAQFTLVISYLRDPECGYCLKAPPHAHMESQKIYVGFKNTRKKKHLGPGLPPSPTRVNTYMKKGNIYITKGQR